MISINIEKAKAIGHEMRRAARLEEFKPFDDIVAKQIPNEIEQAEAQRKIIREKYAAIQTKIDSSKTTDEIKTALGL